LWTFSAPGMCPPSYSYEYLLSIILWIFTVNNTIASYDVIKFAVDNVSTLCFINLIQWKVLISISDNRELT
jgi:hypothetical protein